MAVRKYGPPLRGRFRCCWCGQPGDGLPLASDAFAESMRARAALNTRMRMPHRSRGLGVQAEWKRRMAPPSTYTLTSLGVAICITRSGVGLALAGHRVAALARQGANPNAWQQVRRVLTCCAAHRRASPSTLCQARSKRDHRQDASRACGTRNKDCGTRSKVRRSEMTEPIDYLLIIGSPSCARIEPCA